MKQFCIKKSTHQSKLPLCLDSAEQPASLPINTIQTQHCNLLQGACTLHKKHSKSYFCQHMGFSTTKLKTLHSNKHKPSQCTPKFCVNYECSRCFSPATVVGLWRDVSKSVQLGPQKALPIRGRYSPHQQVLRKHPCGDKIDWGAPFTNLPHEQKHRQEQVLAKTAELHQHTWQEGVYNSPTPSN